MRRITLWLMSTISALVLLFSYPTSTSAKARTTVEAPATVAESGGAAAGSGGSTATDSTSADSNSAESSADATGSTGSSAGDAADGATGADQSAAASTPSSSASGSTAGSSGTSASGTYTGDAVMTRWGVVQVQITVSDGAITKAGVTQIPWDNPRDQQINSYAVPVLNDEVITAQSASIDMVSGATVTSSGYIQSLQSAIDQAHL